MCIYDQLQALNIELPPVRTPAAAYAAFAQTGQLVFISGHTASKNGQPWTGKLGKTMDTCRQRWAVI